MKQWWIRPGKYTSRYASEDVFDAESNLLPAKSSVWLDDFYPCVTEHEFSNGIHVVEYAEYEKLKEALELLKRRWDKVGAQKTVSYGIVDAALKNSP